MLRVNFEVTKTSTHLEQIDEVVIVNTGRMHGEDGQVDYVVKHAGARVGEIRHLPGDGALALTRKALDLILEPGSPRTDVSWVSGSADGGNDPDDVTPGGSP